MTEREMIERLVELVRQRRMEEAAELGAADRSSAPIGVCGEAEHRFAVTLCVGRGSQRGCVASVGVLTWSDGFDAGVCFFPQGSQPRSPSTAKRLTQVRGPLSRSQRRRR